MAPDDEPVPPDDEPALGYAEAVAELERILDELEDETVDVDALARRVRRAAVLIRVCRRRIADARMEVEQIVGELDDGEAPSTDGPRGPA